MIAPKPEDATAESPVSLEEWMKATGRSAGTVRRMLADGTLPSYNTPHGRITPRAWFRRWNRGEWTPDQADNQRPVKQSFVQHRTNRTPSE